jgi:DNA-binding YbaB/EbfC family protein
MVDPAELQARLQKMQEDLAALEIGGHAGGELVKAVLTGKGDLKELQIDVTLLKPEKKKDIEDLVIAAVQAAKRRLDSELQTKMQSMTAGLQLPPGMKLP